MGKLGNFGLEKGKDNYAFPKTLAEGIYNYLKEAIIKGDIEPNQRLQDKNIALRFNVSATPVREAIKRLAGEGLIELSSHREAMVREVSYKELMEIYQAMNCVDEMCMKIAFNKSPDTTIQEIQKYITLMEKVAQKEIVEKYLEMNEQLQLRICEIVGNEFLYQIRQLINNQLGRYRTLRFFLFTKTDAIEETLNEFRSLIKILKSNDRKKIQNLNRSQWVQYLPTEAEWEEYKTGKGGVAR